MSAELERCRNLKVRPKVELLFCSIGGVAAGLLMFGEALLRLIEDEVLEEVIEL
jgi:hypothetical protein